MITPIGITSDARPNPSWARPAAALHEADRMAASFAPRSGSASQHAGASRERRAARSQRALTDCRSSAGPTAARQGRKPRSGGAARASLDGVTPAQPGGSKQARPHDEAHSPSPRLRPKLQSTPPLSSMIPEMCRPMRLSRTGCQGSRAKPRPPSAPELRAWQSGRWRDWSSRPVRQ